MTSAVGMNTKIYSARLGTYQSIEKQNPGIFTCWCMGRGFMAAGARSDGDWLRHRLLGSKDRVYYREHFRAAFFNHFLKGQGDISAIKKLNVFDTGAERVARCSERVADKLRRTPALYLLPNGKLRLRGVPAGLKDGALDQFDQYVSDPWIRFLTLRRGMETRSDTRRFHGLRINDSPPHT